MKVGARWSGSKRRGEALCIAVCNKNCGSLHGKVDGLCGGVKPTHPKLSTYKICSRKHKSHTHHRTGPHLQKLWPHLTSNTGMLMTSVHMVQHSRPSSVDKERPRGVCTGH